jgi:hypothetical protein
METVKIKSFDILNIPHNYYKVTLEKDMFETPKTVYFDLLDNHNDIHHPLLVNIVGHGNGDTLTFSLTSPQTFIPVKLDYAIKIDKTTPYVSQYVNATTTLEVPLSPEQQKNITDYCFKNPPVKISMGQVTPFMVPQFGHSNESPYLSLCYKEDMTPTPTTENFHSNAVAGTFVDLASMQSDCYNNDTCIKETYCAGCKTTVDPSLLIVVVYFATLLYILFRYSK